MKKLAVVFTLMAGCFVATAQVKVGDNPGTISPGSVLELESTSKALTLPRMTTVQMQAIPSPLRGMIVFNTDSSCIYLYKANNAWVSISTNEAAYNPWPYHSNDQLVGESGNKKGIVSATGNGLVASGDYSHAEGLNAVASGIYSWSMGNADTSTGNASFALGTQNLAKGSNSLAAGFKNIAAYESSVSMGQENKDSGWASMAMGLQNSIANMISYSNALGYKNEVNGGWSHNVMGESNIIRGGKANTGIGMGNIAAGNYNSLFGNTNEAVTGNANFLAGQNNLVSSGGSNILLGFGNVASANYSAGIGYGNKVYYQSAIALGQDNKDSGWASVAGGLGNTIEKEVQYSASFGRNNISTRNEALLLTTPGAATFSAGSANVNSGYGSVALGVGNRSQHIASLAANHYTLANSYSMSAFGHYNDTLAAFPGQSFTGTEMLFSIGNGINDATRRNSFTMLRNGFTTINTSTEPGPHMPRAELDVKGTGAIIVPVGTSAQRPETPVVGMIRFCTDCATGGGSVLQGYNGTEWVNL